MTSCGKAVSKTKDIIRGQDVAEPQVLYCDIQQINPWLHV